MISLELMKSSEVRKAGDQSMYANNCLCRYIENFACYFQNGRL